MSEPEPERPDDVLATRGPDVLAVRGAIGGTLMGLANLVPGISGGTMLLASGVYTAFISGIAEVTTLRFRTRTLVLLGTVMATAAVAILLLAGTVKGLVQDHRWVMYSLFIGLTLGGVPLLLRKARPLTRPAWFAAAVTLTLMVVMATMGDGSRDAGGGSPALLFLSGLAAASAMILPGVSGGYLLLLLGQYEAILGAVDKAKTALLGDSAPDLPLFLDSLSIAVPVGLGVAFGVVGVSNLVRWLLDRYEKATLGALLGLLVGAVVGLWPFQESQRPEVGMLVKGQRVTEASVASIDVDDWPVRFFDPSPGHLGGALALICVGFGTTVVIGRIGKEAPAEGYHDNIV